MSEYTPTTADIRHGYIVTSMRYTPETDDHLLAKRRREVADEFDRWLDQVKADARREGQADAWGEGYGAGAQDMGDLRAGELTFQTITTNPYRREADQ